LLQQMGHKLEEIKSVTRLVLFLPTYGSYVATDRTSVTKDGPSIATDKSSVGRNQISRLFSNKLGV